MALDLPTILASASIVWYCFIFALGLLGCWTARRRYRLRPSSPLSSAPSNVSPGVSVLRPLKGLDTNLYENLESTFNQEYSNYEIFFCVADENDQALSVVKDLIAKYPAVNVHVIIGEEVVGANPKVNNLIRAYRQASHDILWVLDSNVQVASGTLARSVDILNATQISARRRIALIHHVPLAFSTEPTLGSRVEEAFLNTNHAKMYLGINTVALDSCVVGKSNLYRKSDIERVDGTLKPSTPGQSEPRIRGLPAFGRFLAEDNMIASALWHELDLRHDLSCDVARNSVGNMSLYDYILRRVRWIRVRKHMVLAATILEPFTESIVAGVLASFGMRYLFGIPQWIFLPLHFTAWLTVDLDVYASLSGAPLTFDAEWLKFVGAWAIREALAFPIWAVSIWGSTVQWRGKKYVVRLNGEVSAPTSDSTGSLSWPEWLSFGGPRVRRDHYQPLENSQD